MNCNTERLQFELEIDEYNNNVLLIKPIAKIGFLNDSVYEFNLPDIESADGYKIDKHKIKYISTPSIAYASVDDIKYKLGNIDIKDELIIYHLKEASRLIEVLTGDAFKNNNVDFTKEDLMNLRNDYEAIKNEKNIIWRLVVYKASYEVLSAVYVTMLTKPNRVKEVLSDLQNEYQFDLIAMKRFLDGLKDDYNDEKNKLGSCTNMAFALRGRTAMPINVLPGAAYHTPQGTNSYGRIYDNTSNNYFSRRW